ncbi:MAG TPA: hypothetical protein VHP34_09495, partial [Alphaproteobacteria bacterium]|nr:hypothetical protein [Alphaproteobacteria bacterium]
MLSNIRYFLVFILFCAALGTSFAVRAADQGLSEVDLLSGFKTDVFWTDGAAVPSTSGRPQCDGTDMNDAAAVTPFAPTQWAVKKGPRPAIAIVIDDVGLDAKRSLRTVELPSAVTLAYLPYSPNVV